MMSASSPPQPLNIKDLLSRLSADPESLCRKAEKLSRIQQSLRSELAFPLRDHLFVAACEDRCLVLFTDGPAWAARLRFQTPRILDLVRGSCGLPLVDNVRIKVSVPLTAASTPARRLVLSESAARTLRRTADSLSDPVLRACLNRLAARR